MFINRNIVACIFFKLFRFFPAPYFAHDILNLYYELQPDRIIWAINDPVFTATSFYNKGWYLNHHPKPNKDLVSGFQPQIEYEWSHIFGRPEPTGSFYNEWKNLTRIGKLGWYLNTVVTNISNQIMQIPQNKIFIFNLLEADQNYSY